jgi:hypothetical protein
VEAADRGALVGRTEELTELGEALVSAGAW